MPRFALVYRYVYINYNNAKFVEKFIGVDKRCKKSLKTKKNF